MKGKQLLILLALVIVLGGAGFLLQKGNRASWSESAGGGGAKVLNLPVNDVNGVARVVIKTADGEVNLVKKNDVWTVQERADYPANFQQLGDLLLKLWNLKTVQEVQVGPSQFPRLELVEPGKGTGAGTLIEFKDKDGKRIGALLLGKKYLKKGDSSLGDTPGFAAGRYVMPVGGTAKISLVSESLDEVDVKAERWLQHDFFKLETPKTIALAGTTDAMHWKLERDSATADWKLADAKPDEKLDTAKVSSLGTLFSSASFADVLAPDAKPADTGLDKPAVATFETFDNFTYTLKIGKLTGDNYPVLVAVNANLAKERTPGKDEKPEDKAKLDQEFQATHKRLEEKLAADKKFEGRPYLVAKYTIESLRKERPALLAEKKPETPAPTSAPTSATTPPLTIPPAPAPKAAGASKPPVRAPVPTSATTPPLSIPAKPATPHPLPSAPMAKPPVPVPQATPAAPPAVPPAPPKATSAATPSPTAPAGEPAAKPDATSGKAPGPSPEPKTPSNPQ